MRNTRRGVALQWNITRLREPKNSYVSSVVGLFASVTLAVGGLDHSASALQLLQLNQKRRVVQRDTPVVGPTGPLLSTEALAALLNFSE